MQRLISWEHLEIRIDGAKANALAASIHIAPIERMELKFSNGLLHVSGSFKKIVSVSFTVDIREIKAGGKTVRVLVASATALGGVPIPKFLFGLVKSQLPADVVTFEEPATFVVSLAHFLPPFMDADVQKITIVDGGLAVTLGPGGTDLPPSPPPSPPPPEAAHG